MDVTQGRFDTLKQAVARARIVLSTGDSELVEKTIWSSPAGKKRLSKRLAAMLPAHKTYVEPFAGSAAVLFAKEPAGVEAINDADLEIVRAYKTIKRLGSKDLSKLRARKWTGDEATYKQLVASSPTDDVAWLHKFLYTTHFSYGKMRGKSFSPSVQGVEARTVDRIEQFAPRLKKVQIFGGDYRKVVSKFDGKDTVFFLDPPYVGYDVHVGEGKFDEHTFFDVLKSLKGKFLITYGIRGELPKLLAKSDFLVKRIRTPRTIASMRGVGGPKMLTQLLVTNYEPTKKSLEGLILQVGGLDEERRTSGSEKSVVSVPVAGKRGTVPAADDATKPKDYNAADTKFAREMIPHHEMAIEMAAAVERDGENEDIRSMAASISTGQAAEVKTLRTWLAAREEAAFGPSPKDTMAGNPFEKSVRLIKGADPGDERFVLGIVLEPDIVDAQGDTYSIDEVRQAAHRFMEEFGGLGLMHQMRVNDQVKILESYLAPGEVELGGVAVRKGTWLLAVHVLSDQLWEQVKSGQLTGFSIGGSARKIPEPNPPTDRPIDDTEPVQEGAA